MQRTAPVAAVYVPAPQSMHTDDPVVPLYFPASHAVHVSPTGPVDPVLQVQFAKAALPGGELEFDGQALHVELDEDPNSVEYFPAPQVMHRDAPVAVEYVPAPQSVHVADPVVTLYFPFTHTMHGPPAGPE